MSDDGTLVEFDDNGLPVGDAGDAWVRGVVRDLFTGLEVEGWDQPHRLYAILSPVMSEARAGGEIAALLAEQGIPVPEHGSVRSVTALATDGEHPRLWMPGLTAPPGTAALLLVQEAWYPHTPRPGDDPAAPDYPVEVRDAVVMRADGDASMYRLTRGSDPSDPASYTDPLADTGAVLVGLVSDLMRRILGLPVTPISTVGEALGTAALSITVNWFTDNPDAAPPEDRDYAIKIILIQTIAGLLDGLDTANPDTGAADLHDVLANGPRFDQVPDMLREERLDDLLDEAEAVADAGWDVFFTRPGANRWLTRDADDRPLTDEMRAWYSTGFLTHFIDAKLPYWQDEADRLRDLIADPDIADDCVGMLIDIGWARPGAE